MKKYTIINDKGMHARPVSKWLAALKGLDANVTVEYNGKDYNGNSMIGLMTMGATKGSELVLKCQGEDAGLALEKLGTLIEEGFGE